MIELLAPSGDIERLKTAIKYGADAVYVGGMEFGLRKGAINFTNDDLKESVQLVHKHNKKIYVTMNIIPHDNDLEGLDDYIKFLDSINVDAVIVSDPGILYRVKELSDLEIHFSTQGSVTNSESAKFWHKMGAKRIVLARELSLDEIKTIRKNTPTSLELEVFCHGAMCMSYSGRCLISSFMTGRDANRGDCSHPCRYKYHLVEEKRPGEFFPIEEVDGGTYLLNSKDLCTLPFVDKLIEAGASSLKIEGRMKSPFYVANVLRVYRKAINDYLSQKESYVFDSNLLKELTYISHRPYTDGFYFGDPKEDGQFNKSSSYQTNAQYIGDIIEVKNDRVFFNLKNGLNNGDTVEAISPTDVVEFKVNDLRNNKNIIVERANVPNEIFSFKTDVDLTFFDYIRRVIS